MKSMSDIKSVNDKIAFFDNWVKSLIEVDPKEVRAKARKQTSPVPPPSEIKLEQPTPPKQKVQNPDDEDYGDEEEENDPMSHLSEEDRKMVLESGAKTKLEQPVPSKQKVQNPDDEDYGDDNDDQKPSTGYGPTLEQLKATKSNYGGPIASPLRDEVQDKSSGYGVTPEQAKGMGSGYGNTNVPISSNNGDDDTTSDSDDTPVTNRFGNGTKIEGYEDDESLGLRQEDETGPGKVEEGTGLEGLPLGEKYKGEDQGKGWQVGRKDKDGRQIRTKYYNEDEKEKSEIKFDEETGLAESDWETVSGHRGFVVDPKTGNVHQFEEGAEIKGNESVTTHHSSPLAGGDVAGAGKMNFDRKGQLTSINDQSGHYKPGGKFTFQAVRAVNMATLSDELKVMLRKATSRSKDGGEPESPDTIQQLIAAEIQKKREVYFQDLSEQKVKLERELDEIKDFDEEDRKRALFEIDHAFQEKSNEFRDIARKIEQDLLEDMPKNPLLDTREHNRANPNDKKLPKNVRELAEAQETVRALIEETLEDDENADVSELRKQDEKLTAMLRKLGFNEQRNKETKVSLLGKSGMLSDEEYKLHWDELKKITNDPNKSEQEKTTASQKFNDDVNRASAVKQLRQPLGEEAFAQLLKQGHDKVTEALEKAGLKPGEPGSLDKLKAQLGEQRVSALSEQELGELSLKYKVKKVANPQQGVEVFGFDVGQATQTTLTAQQFLQTGGNEAQIRTKDRLTGEIEERSGDIQGGKATGGADFDKERERLIAAKQKQLGGDKQLSEKDIQDIDETIEKQKKLRESLKQEASQGQPNPSIGLLDEANYDEERKRLIVAKEKKLGKDEKLSEQDIKEIDEAIEKQKTKRNELIAAKQKQKEERDALIEAKQRELGEGKQLSEQDIKEIDEAIEKQKNDRELDDLLGEVMKNPIVMRKNIESRQESIKGSIEQLDNNIEYWKGSPLYADMVEEATKEKEELEQEAKLLEEQLKTL